MDRCLYELVGVTSLAGIALVLALSRDNLFFAAIFASAVAIGGREIIRR